jgi:phenylalanyl-tRNA synthetase beta chain
MAQNSPTQFRLRANLRGDLAAYGFSEILSYSFINPAFLDWLGLAPGHPWRREGVKVLNPLSEDHGLLRPSLAPGLLAAYRLNQFHGRWSAALFEVGATFHALEGEDAPLERPTLGFLLAGKWGQGSFNDSERPVDFWDLKGLVEELGEKYDRDLAFAPLGQPGAPELPFYEPGQGAIVLDGGRPIGQFGQLAEKAHKNLGLKATGGLVFFGELDLSLWPAAGQRAFRSWSSYPGVYRDLAILVDETVPAQAVLDQILADRGSPLTQATIFDVYKGEKIPAGQKSLAIRLFFQSAERTLTDELVNGYFNSLAARLAERLAATLRS